MIVTVLEYTLLYFVLGLFTLIFILFRENDTYNILAVKIIFWPLILVLIAIKFLILCMYVSFKGFIEFCKTQLLTSEL